MMHHRVMAADCRSLGAVQTRHTVAANKWLDNPEYYQLAIDTSKELKNMGVDPATLWHATEVMRTQ